MSQINAKELIDDEENRVEFIEYNGRNIEVKTVLSYPEMLGFVSYVVDSCFDDETGEYTPEKRDFMLRFATIDAYTNIELPGKYGDAYDFLYSIDELLLEIKNIISSTQFTAIIDAIDSNINAMVEKNANDLMSKISDLYNEVYSLIDTLDKQFDGIDDNDMKRLVDAMIGTGFDTNRFVESYIESKDSDE